MNLSITPYDRAPNPWKNHIPSKFYRPMVIPKKDTKGNWCQLSRQIDGLHLVNMKTNRDMKLF